MAVINVNFFSGIFGRISSSISNLVNKGKQAVSTYREKRTQNRNQQKQARENKRFPYDETLREYRDDILEILNNFEFDSDIIEFVENMESDDIAEIDFERLNNANERMKRYISAYEKGFIPDFDKTWYEYEMEKSIPAYAKYKGV